MAEAEETSEWKLLICLSGGGLRATFYHLGVIRSLRKAGLLPQVRTICAVSGGSITAAHVISKWSDFTGTDAQFEMACGQLLALGSRDIRGRVIRRWLFSFRWFSDGRIRSLAKEYATFFGKKMISDLYPSDVTDPAQRPPDVHFLSTSFTTGQLCSFSAKGFSIDREDGTKNIQADLIALDLAIAASSAFPPLFPPVKLSRDDIGADPLVFPAETIFLTDGGVYDNLGVVKCVSLASSLPEPATIIVSDAGGAFDWQPGNNFAGVISRTVRTTDILMRNAANDAIRALAGVRHQKIVHVPISCVTENSPLPLQIQSFIRQIRTDLDRFSATEMKLLVTHGEVVADAKLRDAGLGLKETSPLRADFGTVTKDRLLTCVMGARKRKLGLFNSKDPLSYGVALLPVVLSAIFIALLTMYVAYQNREQVKIATTAIAAEQEAKINKDAVSDAKTALEQKLKTIEKVDTLSTKANTLVLVQFAGFPRDQIVQLSTALVAKGWKVAGANRGGERTAYAANKNEIRCARTSCAVAEQLAVDLQSTGLVKQSPVIAPNDKIAPGILEIWVGLR